MSRRSVNDMPKVAAKFRPSRQPITEQSPFETKIEARQQDRKRAKLLARYVEDSQKGSRRKQANKLANRLAYGPKDPPPQTLASSAHYRKHRNRIGAALHQLVVKSGIGPIRAFTIIPASWEFMGDDLHLADPAKMLERFRAQLNRSGASKASGFIFCGIHGEFEPNEKMFRLHIHGIAGGAMLKVIDRLRKLDDFKSIRRDVAAGNHRVFHRVQIKKTPLTNLPSPLTYTLQSFWPARAIWTDDATVSSKPGRRRQRQKRRLTEPYHTDFLLWIDRWTIKDLTLLIGLRVTKFGLKATKPPYTN